MRLVRLYGDDFAQRGMQAMEEIKKDEDEESRDVEVNNVEWFDPWSKRLAFEKARPLPGIPELNDDLADTVH